ncbi:NAD(P)-binding domain-containing protein [Arenibacter sp. 6A1]|uniref:lycopene cyclase family protein n=1 Tax=Arenibacter sp. 6A1 TaxID=2720391 RepID=UPI001445FA0C|nr:lycopene cyclase family protein [Arenibacter sp. 6A1]NKI26671.1 NAD(P)-binding domain-containing protein [Arenibacter sp. 6A1]
MTTYDYIIVGAGAAGLMLADALGKDPFFSNTTILILEKDSKQHNDRTWCFWEPGEGSFTPILHKSWNQLFFAGKAYSENMATAPYTYKMVRGRDFYISYLERLKKYPNISFANRTVTGIKDKTTEVEVATDKETFTAKKVFNSAFDYHKLLQQDQYPVLQQHFLGWFVKTVKPTFHPDRATFMDFSIPQNGNTRFMYVLPSSETEALIEYTLFSKKVLSQSEYEDALTTYLKENLGCDDYEITAVEKGNIPMSCFDYNTFNSQNVLHIGIAGGWAKASSGYTFMPSFKKSKQLVQFLKTEKPLHTFLKKDRFWFYDLLLLDILDHDNSQGRLIFEQLFKNQTPKKIFKFLDEETTLWEDLQIIAACPKLLFIKALLRRLL